MFSTNYTNFQPAREVLDFSTFESYQNFRPFSFDETTSIIPNMMEENIVNVEAPNFEDSIIESSPKNERQPLKKMKSNTTSPSPSTSAAGSTNHETKSSTNSGTPVEETIMNIEEDQDAYNIFYFDYDLLPQSPKAKACKGNGCSKEERRLKKVIIQDVTRSIVGCLRRSASFKNAVLGTVCQWLDISEQELFEHLQKTFNGTVGNKTCAKIASQSELYGAIKNRKLCEIWSRDTDILTKVAWHTIKIFFVDDDGKHYNDWINFWKAGNEEDKKLFLRFRTAFWPRFENPDEYLTPAQKRLLAQNVGMNTAGNIGQVEVRTN